MFSLLYLILDILHAVNAGAKFVADIGCPRMKGE